MDDHIQLYYWHLEHAIDKWLKDKKSKTNTYSAAKALEAHHKFNFIDPSWIQGGTGSYHSDNFSKELLEMIKKHSNIHPLIPVTKDYFLTSEEIYRLYVQEVYQFAIRVIF